MKMQPHLIATLSVLVSLMTAFTANAQGEIPDPPPALDDRVQILEETYRTHGQDSITEVLLLGVFHFKGSTTDARSADNANMLQPERQEQISVVLDRLAAFAPTRIGVEVKARDQQSLNQEYERYLTEGGTLSANEIHQLGFRLGKRLGHARLYAVDADGRRFDSPDIQTVARQADQGWLFNDPVEDGWNKVVDITAAWSLRSPLREHLLLMNDPRVHRILHAIYLTRDRAISNGTDYPGADGFVSHWYNRNIRIYGNILRMAEASEDKADERLLVIIGNGHVPILRHLVDNSGSLTAVDVAEVLKK